MLDFTSALYLGLEHSSSVLRPWQELTTGSPAALVEPAETHAICRALATLQGCEAATLSTSTLHVAWDLLRLLAKQPVTLFMDAGVYPISQWGAENAAVHGACVTTFSHHNPAALAHQLSNAPRGRTPIVISDGFCTTCGRVAPLRDYLTQVRRTKGLLVVDDTQALGVLGHSPDRKMPYGSEGGGSLRWCDINGPDILVFASMAKGFGVPMAVLAGSQDLITAFEEESLTRVHCSPPSIVTLRAAEHALRMNNRDGNSRRSRLVKLVQSFRHGLRTNGIEVHGGDFPIQSLPLPPSMDPHLFQQRLERRGLRGFLRSGRRETPPQITLLLTARHTFADTAIAVEFLNQEFAQRRARTLSPIPLEVMHHG